jgi:lantibiotic biosynthesis protein
MPLERAGDGEILEAAVEIGRRLCRTARWSAGACTWSVPARSPMEGGEEIGGCLYRGTAGVALFLAELHATGAGIPGEFAGTALGALANSVRQAPRTPHRFGLHAGRMGVAVAASVVGERTGDHSLAGAAEALLRPLSGREDEGPSTDIISGAAGGITALLWLRDRVDPALVVPMAAALGNRLLRLAERTPVGWSWRTIGTVNARHLCGYSHGAAGIGHALVELLAVTGDTRFQYAAEQAFAYERRFFDPARGNWPDFRDAALSAYVGDQTRLRVDLAAKRVAPDDPAGAFMRAWCHGAPGIGLSRLRAYEVLGGGVYLAEARAAMDAAAQALQDREMDDVLCHGVAGLCEILREGGRALGEPAWTGTAEAALAGVARRASGANEAPAGQAPGLMVGEAGIGLALLRSVRGGVFSPLCLTRGGEARVGADPFGYEAMQREEADRCFGASLRAWSSLGVDVTRAGDAAALGAVREWILARTALAPSPERAQLLADAARADLEHHSFAAEDHDLRPPFLARITRAAPGTLPWADLSFTTTGWMRLVTVAHDWDTWVRDPDRPLVPPKGMVFHVIHVSPEGVRRETVNPLLGLVLSAIPEANRFEPLVQRVRELARFEDVDDRDGVERYIVQCLELAHARGFVQAHAGPVS